MIRVAVDAMGADLGPEEIVAGAREAASESIAPILFGAADLDARGLELVATADVIEMGESPAEAVRAKPDSSLVAACRAVAEGRADAVVSAGNTGAMLAAGLFELRRIPGVFRPAIAVVIPSPPRPFGADRRRRQRRRQARAPAPVRDDGLGVRAGDPRAARPRRCGCSRSARSRRRATRSRSRRTRCSSRAGSTSRGNIESRELLEGAADVVVCDGFTGNVCLKLIEGTSATLLDAFREEIVSTARGRLGGLLIRPAARRLREQLDPDAYGGAYLLGLKGVAVVAHGNSNRRAIASAIGLAARGVEHRVVERLAERLPGGVVASARSTTPTPR